MECGRAAPSARQVTLENEFEIAGRLSGLFDRRQYADSLCYEYPFAVASSLPLSTMSPFTFVLVFLLAVLDVAWAVGNVPHILQDHVRRQVLQNAANGIPASTNGSTIVSISLAKDLQTYYALLSVGNISFRVGLDTASSDLWLFSSNCASSACKSSPKYPLSYDSPSFVSVNGNATTFNVSYADTSMASGFIAMERVNFTNLSLSNQAFGLMNSSNITFVDQVSGIMGLSFARLSTINSLASNAAPFFTQLAQQGKLDYPLIGVSLPRNTSTTGSLALGAVDSSVVTNVTNIVWNQVVPFRPFGSESNTSSYLQWAIHLSNISVGTSIITPQPTYPQPNANASIALLDVGTAGIYGPYQDVSRIFSAIDSSRLVDSSTGTWAIPCDTNETMSFTFGGYNFTLLPSDYLIGPVSADPTICLSWPRALPPSSDGIDWQLGSTFLRTVYSIFSYGITSKELPMIGLYPLTPANATALPEASLSSLFSSLSLTVATALPNSLVAAPIYSTPSYIFNTSVPTSVLATNLATSTYAPLFSAMDAAAAGEGSGKFNFSALPQATPSPTQTTLVLTDKSGMVYTTTSVAATPNAVLGEPYGWTSGAGAVRTSITAIALASGLVCLLQWSGMSL
ncbi:hypothetical protein EW146_g6091 [Bondarzewia mesenterica]|uniref:Peptidase A1 domain-containing protein n=1 Tax=Bondarzewia mesenterica TaxID=1095465 RepID=A0A4V3XEM7_9AGAM|nr:hypothetical protein EW146_g6091 [Bondarzewia mesenterica]